MMKQRYSQLAFTLAELLITLAILGVIATFTIPKILDSGSNSQKNAMTKEAAAMIAESYQQYLRENGHNASMKVEALTPYMNYVKKVTVGSIDNTPGLNSRGCTTTWNFCLQLHNGGMMRFYKDANFNGTETTSALYIYFDPDGTYSGVPTGPGKSVRFLLYYNGRITSAANALTNTYINAGPLAAEQDPEWLSWSN